MTGEGDSGVILPWVRQGNLEDLQDGGPSDRGGGRWCYTALGQAGASGRGPEPLPPVG